jgi:DNA primase
MRAMIENAQSLSDVLWQSETEGRDFGTPERRAGLESTLQAIVKDIRDPKIAEYYKRDFDERVFKAFKQRPGYGPRGPGGGRSDWQPRARGGKSPAYAGRNERSFERSGDRQSAPRQGEQRVSPAVRRSHHVVNAKNASRVAKEHDLMALAVEHLGLVEHHLEPLAKVSLLSPELDRLKRDLLHLAASSPRLEKSVVENHLTAQGHGVLIGELRKRPVLRLEAGAGGSDDAWRQTMAQLEDPDFSLHGDLKLQRDEALERYLGSRAEADLDEMQRLNGLIRAQAGS